MLYRYENYACNVCYQANAITGKNYTYKNRKNQYEISWFDHGKRKTFIYDSILYRDQLKLSAYDVAKMVVTQ